MVDMNKVWGQISAYENTTIEVNGKKVYIDLYYRGMSLDSFRIKDDYFGNVLYKGETSEELEEYLNNL